METSPQTNGFLRQISLLAHLFSYQCCALHAAGNLRFLHAPDDLLHGRWPRCKGSSSTGRANLPLNQESCERCMQLTGYTGTGRDALTHPRSSLHPWHRLHSPSGTCWCLQSSPCVSSTPLPCCLHLYSALHARAPPCSWMLCTHLFSSHHLKLTLSCLECHDGRCPVPSVPFLSFLERDRSQP